MKKPVRLSTRIATLAVLLVALAAGCNDKGRDAILGVDGFGNAATVTDTTRPRVTTTQPATTSPGPTPDRKSVV